MSRRDRRLQRRNIMKKKQVFTVPTSTLKDTEPHSSTHHHKKRNLFVRLYEDSYKKLMLIPILMLIISLAVIGLQVSTTGSIMEFGVSITGGTSITVPDVDDFVPVEIEQQLLEMLGPTADVNVRKLVSEESIDVSVEASGADAQEMLDAMQSLFGEFSDYSLEETGSTLGEAFFRQSLFALLFAFILMGVVVFLSFKSFVPSMAVILSAIFDIVVTMAVVNVLGIRVSAAGLAGFLMLIGYSVDTDILMASKILRGKKGSVIKNIYDAMGTGLMMAVTTIVVLVVGILVSNSDVLTQIMTIVLIGLSLDIISTWIQNTGMMRIYMERKD